MIIRRVSACTDTLINYQLSRVVGSEVHTLADVVVIYYFAITVDTRKIHRCLVLCTLIFQAAKRKIGSCSLFGMDIERESSTRPTIMICYLWNDTLYELHIGFKHLPVIVFIICNFVYSFCSSIVVWFSFSLHNSLIHFYLLSLFIKSLHISRNLLFWSRHCDRLQMRMVWNEWLVRASRRNRNFERRRHTLLWSLAPGVSELVL